MLPSITLPVGLQELGIGQNTALTQHVNCMGAEIAVSLYARGNGNQASYKGFVVALVDTRHKHGHVFDLPNHADDLWIVHNLCLQLNSRQIHYVGQKRVEHELVVVAYFRACERSYAALQQ